MLNELQIEKEKEIIKKEEKEIIKKEKKSIFTERKPFSSHDCAIVKHLEI